MGGTAPIDSEPAFIGWFSYLLRPGTMICPRYAQKVPRRTNRLGLLWGIDLAGKFSRGVEHFYAAIWGQLIETKEVSIGFPDALVEAVGEANRGSL